MKVCTYNILLFFVDFKRPLAKLPHYILSFDIHNTVYIHEYRVEV